MMTTLKRPILTAAVLGAALSAPVFADGNDDGPCGPHDPDCSRRIGEVFLQRTHLLRPEAEAGVRFGSGTYDAAVRVGFDVLTMDNQHGDFTLLPFEAMWVPDAGGFRIRFGLAESEISLFCQEPGGGVHAPQNLQNLYAMIRLSLTGSPGKLPAGCEPDAMWGIGGDILDIQHDTDTGRWAARWADIHAVVNFLRNGNSREFMKARLMAFAGASVETVWPGDTPGAPDGDADTMARLKFGVTGMVRSDNNRWEFRAFAGYRPNVVDWTDFAVEARAEVLYNILFGDSFMGSVGLTGEYSYWSDPSRSIGTYASDRDPHSGFVGAMFRLSWQ